MKLRLRFKDPNHALQVVDGAAVDDPEGFEAARSLVRKFVWYDEYITIEFDTETRTARVVTVEEK